MHESSEAIKQPKDFTKINKSLLQKSIKEEKLPEKELRKKLGNIRKKDKKGHKPEKIVPNTEKVMRPSSLRKARYIIDRKLCRDS